MTCIYLSSGSSVSSIKLSQVSFQNLLYEPIKMIFSSMYSSFMYAENIFKHLTREIILRKETVSLNLSLYSTAFGIFEQRLLLSASYYLFSVHKWYIWDLRIILLLYSALDAMSTDNHAVSCTRVRALIRKWSDNLHDGAGGTPGVSATAEVHPSDYL